MNVTAIAMLENDATEVPPLNSQYGNPAPGGIVPVNPFCRTGSNLTAEVDTDLNL